MQNIKEYEAMAKISLTGEEREWADKQADMLIKSFDELEKIDTDNTEPLVSVLDISNILREDIVNKTVSREQLLATAPEQYDGYVVVPKTVE